MNPTRAHGYETMRTVDGSILQAGVKSRPITMSQDLTNVGGWVTRAVVLQTYYPDEETRGPVKSGQRSILCDVRTYGRFTRVLSRVPVLQDGHGLFDVDVRIPRGSRQNLSGGDVVGQASSTTSPTAAEQLDGDHVLVGFLDNDPSQPVVLPYTLAHPQARYAPAAADGRVRRIRHQGVVFEISQAGSVLLDARGAAKEELGAGGTEVSNSGTGGELIFATKDGGGHQTSIVLDNQGRMFFGGDPASRSTAEPVFLGTQATTILMGILDGIIALSVGTGVGPSSTPINAATFVQLKTQLQNKVHLSDFIFVRKTY